MCACAIIQCSTGLIKIGLIGYFRLVFFFFKDRIFFSLSWKLFPKFKNWISFVFKWCGFRSSPMTPRVPTPLKYKRNPIFKFGKQFTYSLGEKNLLGHKYQIIKWDTPILERKKDLKYPISPIWINPEEKVYYIVIILIYLLPFGTYTHGTYNIVYDITLHLHYYM